MISVFLPLITLALLDLINSVTTNLLNSGDTSLSGMFRGLLGLLAVALGAAAAAAGALRAVLLGFFFFSGDFIFLMDLLSHLNSSLSSWIDLFNICLLSMSTGEQILGI